jgi:hypothetical protein
VAAYEQIGVVTTALAGYGWLPIAPWQAVGEFNVAGTAFHGATRETLYRL